MNELAGLLSTRPNGATAENAQLQSALFVGFAALMAAVGSSCTCEACRHLRSLADSLKALSPAPPPQPAPVQHMEL